MIIWLYDYYKLRLHTSSPRRYNNMPLKSIEYKLRVNYTVKQERFCIRNDGSLHPYPINPTTDQHTLSLYHCPLSYLYNDYLCMHPSSYDTFKYTYILNAQISHILYV